jgi:phosphoglycolate phosphatase-like HAD superfamily hydrolase
MINKEIRPEIIENLSLDYMTTPTVLVLDLDLTLHNVVEHYEDSVNSTLSHFGFSELTHEEICRVIEFS